MTRDEVRAVIVGELGRIAPDVDANTVDAKADLREAFDIDSMDFLNLVMAIHKRLGIDIAEPDYPQLRTLQRAIDYVHARVAGPDRSVPAAPPA